MARPSLKFEIEENARTVVNLSRIMKTEIVNSRRYEAICTLNMLVFETDKLRADLIGWKPD